MSTRILTLPGTLDALPPAMELAEHGAEEAGLSPKAAYGLQLAVDELVTNVALHAYEERGLTGEIGLRLEITPESLTFAIEDTGEPYDPRTRDVPDLDKPLEDRQVGGLGIFLAMKSVDEFRYERDGNKNRNILIVRRGADKAGAPDGFVSQQ
jgi:anti-sigma regulatory factor (Ser/Thr protein kinase)